MPIITHAARMLEIVARYGSIRKASERVNSASSAVNRQILNLEAEYGTPLFTRHPRGMRLTEAGKILVEQIRQWQAQEHEIRANIEAIKGQTGQVKIGVMECFAPSFAPRLVELLEDRGEDLRLDVTVGGTGDISAKLHSGEIDLAIAFNVPGEFGFKSLFETKMELGVVMHPDHELSKFQKVPRDELNRHPLILADQTLTISPIVNSMLSKSRMTTFAASRSNSVAFIKSLVQRGKGVSFLTMVDVYEEVIEGTLHFAQIDKAQMQEALSICVPDADQMTEATAVVSAVAGEELERIRRDFHEGLQSKG